MRKLLLSFLLLILLAVFGVMVVQGYEFGTLRIGYSIQDIIDENKKLDTQIATLGNKIDTEYQAAKSGLDSSFRKLQTEKQNYQDIIQLSSTEEVNAAIQTEEYKLNYLWTKIGSFATKNNLVMKVDLSHGTSGVSNQYNISFVVIGEYIDISEFVYAIEKEPTLGFRIEEFALVPYSEDTLQATFIIKNVAIEPASLDDSGTVESGTVTTNTQSAKSGDTTSNEDTTSSGQE